MVSKTSCQLLLLFFRICNITTKVWLSLTFYAWLVVDLMNTSSLTHLVLKQMEQEGKHNGVKLDEASNNLLNRCFQVSCKLWERDHPVWANLFSFFLQGLVPKLLKIDSDKYPNINLKRHLQLSKKPNFRCNRKFCHACLKLCYDDDFKVCKNNRSWICHFCYGVCFCTRCLR